MNNGTKITAPISLHADVYPVLGIAPSGSYYDVAEACTSGKINKWSYKKPIRYSQVATLTDAQIQSVNCGLSPRELTLLRTNCNGWQGTKTNYTKSEILAQATEWAYFVPTSYFRLSDFNGYNNNAQSTDKDWLGYSFLLSDLTAFVDSDASLASTSGGVNYTIDKQFKQMTSFAINVSGNYNYIGGANEDMLPLSYAAGGGVVAGQGWRIAYAVQIPYNTSGASSNEWYLFIGRKVLNSSDEITTVRNYCPPDMSSNTLAVNALIYNVQSKGVKTFTMIPCLVKNAMLTFHALSASVKRSQVILNSDAVIYSMPSGAKSVNLTITTSGEMPQIGNIVRVKASNNYNDDYTWVLGYVQVQVNSDGSTVYAMVVARRAVITGTFTVNLNLKYKTTASGDNYIQIPTSGSGTAVYTIDPNNATFSFGGVQYNGRVITTALGLNFDEDDVSIFTVS